MQGNEEGPVAEPRNGGAAALSQAQMKRLTAVHGWSGTLLGLLLYIVVATGTIAVFAQEIREWSVGASAPPGIDVPVDAAVRKLAAFMPRGVLGEVGIWRNSRGEVVVAFHTHATNPASREEEDFGTVFHLDPATGEVVSRLNDFYSDALWDRDGDALSSFLIDMHVALYLPYPWGYILVGVLGLLMMFAALSGLLMHRHLIRDLFVAARSRSRLVGHRDRHALASSWSLPFAIILAFTGSFYALAFTITSPILTEIAFGGDEEAMEETLWAPPVAEDTRRAEPADLDAVIGRSSAEVGGPAEYVGISNYGRADSRISVWHHPPEGRLTWVQTLFDGVSGAYLGPRPEIGNAFSVGSSLFALMWPLHVGDFAGVASKLVWVGLGATTGFVVLTGLSLWVRRREAEPAWRRFGLAIVATGYGVPLGAVAAAHGAFLSGVSGDPFLWTPISFFATALGCYAAAWRLGDPLRLRHLYLTLLAYGCLALPIVRLFCGGTSWAEALRLGHGEVIVIDLLLFAGGGLMLAWRGSWLRRVVGIEARQPLRQPAE